MKFIDEVEIAVKAGDGGRGCVAFRREKYEPRGGPSGGDGGAGGDVVLVVDPGLATLFDLALQRHLRAGRGGHGRGKDCNGARGGDVLARVPPGTVVTDTETGELIADLTAAGSRAVVAAGGRGGRGNRHFSTPTNRAPRRAEPGTPGEERRLRLELRVLAEVGLVGKPNAGKSTLLATVTAARPRVADYAFTTLTPHLGVVEREDGERFVIADIPGLIEGAHRGAGLGIRFLRHLSRTAVLVHLLDIGGSEDTDPEDDYDAINAELASYDPELAAKPQIVVATKLDLPEARERFAGLRAAMEPRGVRLHRLSAVTGEGLAELLAAVTEAVRRFRQTSRARELSQDATPPAVDRADARLGTGQR
jgi:GTP-binding protein